MPEPMTSSDIEDVLTSIRRLVAQPGTAPPPAPEGRLLLTPALRVVPGRSDAANAPPAPDRASLERTIAELEAAVSGYAEEWEPDGSEAPQPAANALPAPFVPVPEASLAAPVDADELPRAAPGEAAGAIPTAPELTGEATPTAPMTAGDAPPAAPMTAGEAIDGSPAEAGAPPIQRHDNIRPFARSRAEQPPAFASIALTAANDAVLPTPMMQPEGPEAPVAAEHAPSVPLPPDREALRALVAGIVREELRGELGARITRNVRKFVRSEVAQALAARRGE